MFNENKLNLNLNSKEVNLIVGGKTHNNMRTNILLIFFFNEKYILLPITSMYTETISPM